MTTPNHGFETLEQLAAQYRRNALHFRLSAQVFVPGSELEQQTVLFAVENEVRAAQVDALAEGRPFSLVHNRSCGFCRPGWPCPTHHLGATAYLYL